MVVDAEAVTGMFLISFSRSSLWPEQKLLILNTASLLNLFIGSKCLLVEGLGFLYIII